MSLKPLRNCTGYPRFCNSKIRNLSHLWVIFRITVILFRCYSDYENYMLFSIRSNQNLQEGSCREWANDDGDWKKNIAEVVSVIQCEIDQIAARPTQLQLPKRPLNVHLHNSDEHNRQDQDCALYCKTKSGHYKTKSGCARPTNFFGARPRSTSIYLHILQDQDESFPCKTKTGPWSQFWICS